MKQTHRHSDRIKESILLLEEFSGRTLNQRDKEYSKDLNRLLNKPDEVLVKIYIRSGQLASIYSALGVRKLLKGDLGGLEQLSTGLDFWGWNFKIQCWIEKRRYHGRVMELGLAFKDVPSLACVSAHWQLECINWLPQLMNSIERYEWNEKCFQFAQFVLDSLSFLTGGFSGTISDTIYGRIFQHWNNVEELGHAMDALCDDHCAETHLEESEGAGSGIFSHWPFSLLPCEVMLVMRIRSNLSLPLPTLTHPLVRLLPVGNEIPRNANLHPLVRRLAAEWEVFTRRYDRR
jgi:hypothetical protein